MTQSGEVVSHQVHTLGTDGANPSSATKLIMSIKKIKTVSQSCQEHWHYINAVNWHLKLNHQNNSQSKIDFEWTLPIALTDVSVNADLQEIYDICDIIVQEQIDILALSLYSWNMSRLSTLAKLVKEKLPNLIIVAGGPAVSIDPHRNFMKQHDFLDYAVYGDGEIAFGRLLDHIAGYCTELINVIDSSGHVYPHEVFMDRAILKQSPILTFQDEIREYVKSTKARLKIYSPNIPTAFLWETTKGCAFTCSFCDWSSGLHNKVRIWGKDELEPPWKKELLFFADLGVDGIYWTNPNIGMAAQDEAIVNTWCALKLSNPKTPVIIWPQLAKRHKKMAFKLLDQMLETGVTKHAKFDLQDLDLTVLENIDRPEIPWEEHKILIKNVLHRHRAKLDHQKTIDGFYISAHFIWGLPGQTLNNWLHNAQEVIPLGLYPYFQPFEILPNTPANKIEYQEKFKITVKKIISFDGREITAATSSYSMSEKDWFTGMLLTYLLPISDHVAENIDIQSFFYNFIKQQTIIDESYEHFQRTTEVKLIVSKKHFTVKEHDASNNKIWKKMLKQPNKVFQIG
jgi:hypothetical protein